MVNSGPKRFGDLFRGSLHYREGKNLENLGKSRKKARNLTFIISFSMINNITQLKIYKLLFKGTCNISWLLFLAPVKGNSFNTEMRMKSYTKKH